MAHLLLKQRDYSPWQMIPWKGLFLAKEIQNSRGTQRRVSAASFERGWGACSKESEWPLGTERGTWLIASKEMWISVLQPQETEFYHNHISLKEYPKFQVWMQAYSTHWFKSCKKQPSAHHTQTSDLQNCELTNGFYFKLLNMWWCVKQQ